MMRAERVIPSAGNCTGFGYGEHLLVWSWRRIVTGRTACPVMAHEFRNSFGEDSAEVFLTVCTFLKALGLTSRRPLAIGSPGSAAITADERQMLTLVAAAQAETPALFEAHLSWLTRPQQRHVLKIATDALATALKGNEICLTVPEVDAPGSAIAPGHCMIGAAAHRP